MIESQFFVKKLQNSKGFILTSGVLLIAGGLYGLLSSVLGSGEPLLGWMVAGGLLLLAGIALLALLVDKLNNQEASFSVTTETIKFRQTPLAHERELYWENVVGMRITDRVAEFELFSSEKVVMRFGSAEKPEVALLVSNRLRKAACEKMIPVNGVLLRGQSAYSYA